MGEDHLIRPLGRGGLEQHGGGPTAAPGLFRARVDERTVGDAGGGRVEEPGRAEWIGRGREKTHSGSILEATLKVPSSAMTDACEGEAEHNGQEGPQDAKSMK